MTGGKLRGLEHKTSSAKRGKLRVEPGMGREGKDRVLGIWGFVVEFREEEGLRRNSIRIPISLRFFLGQGGLRFRV